MLNYQILMLKIGTNYTPTPEGETSASLYMTTIKSMKTAYDPSLKWANARISSTAMRQPKTVDLISKGTSTAMVEFYSPPSNDCSAFPWFIWKSLAEIPSKTVNVAQNKTPTITSNTETSMTPSFKDNTLISLNWWNPMKSGTSEPSLVEQYGNDYLRCKQSLKDSYRWSKMWRSQRSHESAFALSAIDHGNKNVGTDFWNKMIIKSCLLWMKLVVPAKHALIVIRISNVTKTGASSFLKIKECVK